MLLITPDAFWLHSGRVPAPFQQQEVEIEVMQDLIPAGSFGFVPAAAFQAVVGSARLFLRWQFW